MHVFKAVAAEKTHNEFIETVQQFDKKNLNHAETTEKNPLPLPEGSFAFCSIRFFAMSYWIEKFMFFLLQFQAIQQEKQAAELQAGIEGNLKWKF